jgi:hypothetical protein
MVAGLSSGTAAQVEEEEEEEEEEEREVGSSERHHGWGEQHISSSVLKVPRHCPFVLLVSVSF